MVWKAFQKQRMGAKCVVVHEACGYFEEDNNREAVMVAFKARLVSKSENFGMSSNRSFGG